MSVANCTNPELKTLENIKNLINFSSHIIEMKSFFVFHRECNNVSDEREAGKGNKYQQRSPILQHL